jgi:glycosyltransferase involved in cell wall biosynthesis
MALQSPSSPPASRCVRVAFLLPAFDIGGAERVVLRTAAGLDRTRYEPIVLALTQGSGRLARELDEAGVPHHAVGKPGDAAPVVLWRLFRWLRQHPCDALMTYMFHANLAGRIVRTLTRLPVLVCSERSVWEETPLRIAINRLTAPLATVITTNSKEGVRVWARRLRRPDASIRLIYNGVDTERFTAPRASACESREPREPLVIGCIARLHPLKGQDTLAEALARLARRTDLPGWRCLVAGDGEDRARLEQLRAALGLEDLLAYVGHTTEPERFLRGVDLFVNASDTEGMPNTVLEAMSSGLPVVATAVGGTCEVVEDGVTGRLVPARDPDALADALADLLRDAPSRAAMGRAGRARVDGLFSVGAMVRATEALLSETLPRRAGVRGTR